jgi:hypothetical protein
MLETTGRQDPCAYRHDARNLDVNLVPIGTASLSFTSRNQSEDMTDEAEQDKPSPDLLPVEAETPLASPAALAKDTPEPEVKAALEGGLDEVHHTPGDNGSIAGQGVPEVPDGHLSDGLRLTYRRKCDQLACGSLPECEQLALEEIKVAQEDLAKYKSTIKPLERYRDGVAVVLDEVKIMLTLTLVLLP